MTRSKVAAPVDPELLDDRLEDLERRVKSMEQALVEAQREVTAAIELLTAYFAEQLLTACLAENEAK